MKGIRKINEQNRLLLLSLAVGTGAGLAAVLLLRLIHIIQRVPGTVSGTEHGWMIAFFPGLGMLLSLLVTRYLVRDNIGHGVTKVLLAVSRNESRIKAHNTWSSLLTSALTIGMGGSVGAEAPIVYTGAALGSQLGQRFKLSHKAITILVGCGAAAAVAGIFKAPLAGVLFTLEILMFNISMSSITPLLAATLAATVISYLLAGDVQPFKCTVEAYSMSRLPFYLVLGLFCALCSRYFQSATLWLEDRFSRMTNCYVRWVVCAMGLGAVIMVFPPLFGEGYGDLGNLLCCRAEAVSGSSMFRELFSGQWGLVIFLVLVMLLKVLSMTLTNSGGGVGGTFGPTLFVGAVAGFVVSRSLNLGFGTNLPENNFVLVGMAGLMAGVMQAPMTAIFLIAEITGGYELFMPLILCSTVSYAVTRIWEKYSIYTKRIAQSGDLLTHDADQSALTLMNVRDYVKDKYPKVQLNTSLRQIIKIFANDSSAVFAVLDSHQMLRGIIDVDNIHKYIVKSDEYDRLTARDIMEKPAVVFTEGESMSNVASVFDRTGLWRIPVVDADGRYVGFLSRSRILIAYRELLRNLTQE